MQYRDAVAYLDSLVNYERLHDPEAMRGVRLERMQRLCRRAGDPQRRFRSVVIAGTNGKCSVCAMLYSMLRESSLRVGLYTSPHLEHLRERIRTWTGGSSGPPLATAARAGLRPGLAGGADESPKRQAGDDWISEDDFAAIVTQLHGALEDARRTSPEQAPTYFEAVTLVALTYFASRQVDVAVLEVGLGGRLDATNVVDQAVSVLTPIDVDHADVLGPEAAAIAREKAGIIKPGQVVITAAQHPEVMDVLRQTCEQHGVPLFTAGRDLSAIVHRADLDGLQLSLTGFRGIYEALELPLVGRHQAHNAALAVGALEALSTAGVPHSLVERGLARAEWPGRIEVMHEAPLILMDGAHNPHAAAALAETLKECCQDRVIHLLMGMSSDKSIEEIGAILGGLAVSATCTKSQHPRACEPVELATRLAPFCLDVHVMSAPVDAYTYLLNVVAPRDAIVVTGSLFLVGELRSALRRAHIHPRREGRALRCR